VRIEIDAAPLAAQLDATRVRQALDNLIDNALRHVAPGGTVSVSATAGDRHVMLTVTDTGPGFSTQVMERMFQPFNRGLGEAEGTGLGLAIAGAIAEAHGGQAAAENLPQGGARVTLTLPVPLPPRAAPSCGDDGAEQHPERSPARE
jgi:signal transduction histidine kinase